MAAPPNRVSPPFTILPHTDLESTRAAVTDIYGKLAVLTQTVNQPTPAPAPVVPAPAVPGFRITVTSTQLQQGDSVISFLVAAKAACVLPPSASVPVVPYTIQNQAGSSAAVTLESPTGEKVNNAIATAYSILPGQVLVLFPSSTSYGNGWIIVGKV